MTRAHLFTLSFLFLLGCPSDPLPPAVDAGTDTGGSMVDAGRDTGGSMTDAPTVVPTSCTMPRAATIAATGTTMLSGNTTGMGMALTRGGCGGTALAPQEILEVTVPGTATETTGIRFTMVNAGTPTMFDTVVEIRETCDDAATARCFDDTNGGEYRSSGAFSAPGGSTRYLVVTGYAPMVTGYMLQGPWQMDLTIVPNQHAPEVASATVLTIGSDVRLGVVGTDADGDAGTARVTFLDAGGTPVGFDFDFDTGTPDETEVFFDLDAPLGATSAETSGVFPELADFATWANVVTATVVVVDAFGQESAEVTATEMSGMYAMLGGACDATNICPTGLVCQASVCAIPAAVMSACDGATALTVSATAPAATVVTVPAGDGVIPNADRGCTESGPSGEALVDFTLPAGTWDVLATTAGTTTGATDTILFLVGACGDPASQVGCADDEDASMDIYSSALEVRDLAAGDYTFVVEVYGGADAPTMVDLEVTLREVLATGATCDPAGAMNRCMTGDCPASGTAVCP